MEREGYGDQARRMAQTLGRYLLTADERSDPQRIMPDAVSLIQDCVRYLGLPKLALALVAHLHPLVERWSTWATWAGALDTVLEHDRGIAARARIAVLNQRSHAARELDEYAAAESAARSALALATELGDHREQATALNKLGMAVLMQDRLDDARTTFVQAEHHAAIADLVLERGRIANNLGDVDRQRGDLAGARAGFERAIDLYSQASDDFNVARAQCNLVDIDNRAGALTAVPEALHQAIATFRRLGARYDYALGLNDLAYLQLSLRQYDAAHETFGMALAECDAIGALLTRARVLGNLAELYVKTHDWTRAEATLNAAREQALLLGKPLLASYADVDHGQMLWDQGDYTGARALWERAYAAQVAAGAPGTAQQTRQLIDQPAPS